MVLSAVTSTSPKFWHFLASLLTTTPRSLQHGDSKELVTGSADDNISVLYQLIVFIFIWQKNKYKYFVTKPLLQLGDNFWYLAIHLIQERQLEVETFLPELDHDTTEQLWVLVMFPPVRPHYVQSSGLRFAEGPYWQ